MCIDLEICQHGAFDDVLYGVVKGVGATLMYVQEMFRCLNK